MVGMSLSPLVPLWSDYEDGEIHSFYSVCAVVVRELQLSSSFLLFPGLGGLGLSEGRSEGAVQSAVLRVEV